MSKLIRHRSALLARSYSSREAQPADAKPSWVPFGRARYGNFAQEPPTLDNQYTTDAFLRAYIQNQIPKEVGVYQTIVFVKKVHLLLLFFRF